MVNRKKWDLRYRQSDKGKKQRAKDLKKYFNTPGGKLVRSKSQFKKRNRVKMEALVVYSGPVPVCACPGCQESNPVFLTIDHMDGGGKQTQS